MLDGMLCVGVLEKLAWPASHVAWQWVQSDTTSAKISHISPHETRAARVLGSQAVMAASAPMQSCTSMHFTEPHAS